MTTKEPAAIPTLRDLQFAIQALPCVHPGTVPQLQTAYEAGHRHALRQAGEFVAERLAATPALPDLMDMLANQGGVIVRTASLDSVQIAAARIEKRMYVREDACGFVHLPPSDAPSKRERELDEALDQAIGQRDTYHDWADKLAEAIAKHLAVDIGEHSNQNCPWAEALEAIEATPALPVPTWQEHMPEPHWEKRCDMNCSPRTNDCDDCMQTKVYGDPIKARDAEIADLRATLNLTKA